MEITVGKTAGFCIGVKRAVEGCLNLAQEQQNVYCLGEIVHNQEVIKELKEYGVNFINDLKEAGGITVIRAHGVPKKIYEIAEKNGIQLKDFTCPNVLKIHKIAEKYANQGFYIFLCGSKKHPENLGTLSHCGKYVSIIENEDEDVLEAIEAFEKSKIKKLLLISQTTYSVEKFAVVEEIVKNEITKDVYLVVNNTICKATELRQMETEIMAKEMDYMIIIWGKNSSNTRKLYDISSRNCTNSVCVENVKELDLEEIKKYNKIGIMAGASTPQKSIDDVIYAIKENM